MDFTSLTSSTEWTDDESFDEELLTKIDKIGKTDYSSLRDVFAFLFK